MSGLSKLQNCGPNRGHFITYFLSLTKYESNEMINENSFLLTIENIKNTQEKKKNQLRRELIVPHESHISM